jgi:hypothetical protein
MTPQIGTAEPLFAVCIRNQGFAASLELRKIYQVLVDPDAAAHHFVRVVDESGEDYLYPEDFFRLIELSQDLQEALRQAV